MEIDQVDLCRYLYKLHFQLLMFLESFSKLLRLISQSHSDITSDKSTEIALIQSELKKVFKLTNKELEEEIQKNGELNLKSQQVTSGSQEITGKNWFYHRLKTFLLFYKISLGEACF